MACVASASAPAEAVCPVSGATKEQIPSFVLPSDPLQAIPAEFRDVVLSPEQRNLVKASAPALASHGVDITQSFYTHIVGDNPGLKNSFNLTHQANGLQAQALANAVYAYATNIDDLTPLLPAVGLINHKHASLYVRPEHYAVVGTYLLEAIQRVLGEAVTAELLGAWAAAYWQLAKILILQEHALYKSNEGMSDWSDFRIARKEKESSVITSFYLEPVDEALQPLPKYQPGQYISIQVEVPSLGCLQPRQYSLSDISNDNQYRISIKRESGTDKHPAGIVSNLMHDEKNVGDIIKVSAPRGTFFTAASSDQAPIVLVSAGVGATSLYSILSSSLADTSISRPVTWIHGSRSSGDRAFVSSLAAFAKTNKNLQVVSFNSMVGENDVQGKHYHHRGRVDLKNLDGDKQLYLNDSAAQYYVCGPLQFMRDIKTQLKEAKVDEARIFTEAYCVGGV